MLVDPLIAYVDKQTIAIGTRALEPNSSQPIKMQAIGVFAAAEKTPTKPSIANSATDASSTRPVWAPTNAPMIKTGSTSPPMKPVPSEIVVKKNFHTHASADSPTAPVRATSAMSVDKPK